MTTKRYDLVIVGAGIVGLAHAAEAVRRGLSVAVVERDTFARGASVRNFGHGCVSGQAGTALAYARVARERWLELGRQAGFWAAPTGTVVAARGGDELAVLREFAADGEAPAVLLDADGVRARVALRTPELVGGAWLPWDVRVDPRAAVGALARWLAKQGVDVRWGTSAAGVSAGTLHTSRGDLAAPAIVLATGHDLDRLFPDLAAGVDLHRCELHMLRVAAPGGARFEPAVLTGHSMLRYAGFADCPSLPALADRLAAERPDLLAVDMNLMFTQLPDGDLIIGDTHALAHTHPPFAAEDMDDLVLAETAGLLGHPVAVLAVRERWRGYYASAPGREFLVAAPLAGVRVVTVTTGIGMTTSHGLAAAVLDDLLA
ncbi:TIGR03364 family FAD-dependent oxidoreductase [Frankia sp. AgKG'84/4]|uniref:TIGR03364 family FAD-dependent oxidoreductase n=1 Tax=Frankia sp. AgKG'84/4 TaxID=573490 RepID=UPI002010050B|nr:TIGR03364 family FAD-dependent oxidoreductase [Frankia sp. AgKG'84/4]MCL9794210.1 TIGR03364 family FAD-dependent oxidoreductase [Frankia sp. AgKG'84/4]